MKQPRLSVLALAFGFAFSACAMAEPLSKADYKAGKDKVGADYKIAKSACKSFSGNAEDICVEEAKGKEKIAKAELESSYKPTLKNQYKARIAVAEATYSIAKERCDDQAGTAKDVCKQEAKAVKTTAEAEAKMQMKVSDANATASGKSTEAGMDAKAKSAEARKDAATTTNDAQFDVAKEKCDKYAGGAKDHCLDQAKKSFGK